MALHEFLRGYRDYPDTQALGAHPGRLLPLNPLVGGALLGLRKSGGFALGNQLHSLNLGGGGRGV